MKILVTGKNGFIARNIIEFLKKDGYEVFPVSHEEINKLDKYSRNCEFVFHLAAVQRSGKEEDFIEGNINYTKKLIYYLEKNQNKSSILFSTSTSIDCESIFSRTKKEAEQILREHCTKENAGLYVYKLNHVFGKYGKPNYNSVVSTFCYNSANNLPITVCDPSYKIIVTYIEDLYADFKLRINKTQYCNEYLYPSKRQEVTLGYLLYVLGNIKNKKLQLISSFENQLYETYLYYKVEGKSDKSLI